MLVVIEIYYDLLKHKNLIDCFQLITYINILLSYIPQIVFGNLKWLARYPYQQQQQQNQLLQRDF